MHPPAGFGTVKYVNFHSSGQMNINPCVSVFVLTSEVINLSLVSFPLLSQTAGAAGGHQREGRKHSPAGAVVFQTQESPGRSDGPEKGERPTHAPAQTAGTSTTLDHQVFISTR